MLMVLKKRMQKNKKRGFTLVEVIVVLVILAILAAIAIPALTGYIDDANDRALISEGRNIEIALQEIVTRSYGDGAPVTWNDETGDTILSGTKTIGDEVSRLTGRNPAYVDSDITEITVASNTITKFSYKDPSGKTVTYDTSATPKYQVS